MNNFIIYSLEIAISLALFYTAYWLFLKNETFFKLNRFYLISSVILSLLIPALNITIGKDSFINKNLLSPIDRYEQSMIGNYVMDDEIILSGNSKKKIKKFSETNLPVSEQTNSSEVNAANSTAANATQKINWLTLLLVVYFIGAALFLIRFAANFIWIFGYALKHQSQQIFGMKVIRIPKNISPFSFLNFIFMSNENYPEAELHKIISHEKIHIQQKHSIDIIFFELLLVFQWFNPFTWFYKSAIKISHEYLADQGTLNSGIDLPEYQYSLLNQVLRKNNFEIASNYNLTIKKRIEMMMKKRSPKLASLKLAIALPVFIFLFSAFAFNNNSSEKSVKRTEDNTSRKDTTIRRVSVTPEYLKLLEGEYVSTNEPNNTRRIIFTEALGALYGYDNGYTYMLIPVEDGKFINPDDNATFEFNTKDKNAISALFVGKINLNKIKPLKGPVNIKNKSLAFTTVKVMLKDGVQNGISFFNKAKDSSNYFISEREINWAGYALLQSGKAKEAAEIFKITTELYPNSFNTYDSYGDALLALGEKTKAIEAFKASLKLNPGCANSLKHLNELGVNTDELTKTAKLSIDYLKLLEGTYLSTNQPNWVRMIKFVEENGVLTGKDNGYKYKLMPMGNGKFINPDDGVALIFDTKDKNAISLLIFGTMTLKKVKLSTEPGVNIKEYAGNYFPSAKKDSVLTSMEIISRNNKLFRFIEVEPESPNRSVELEFVTDNIFYYTDNSGRSIEFIVDDKKQVTGCLVRRQDGTYKFSKKK